MLLEIKLVWPKVQSEKQTVGKTSKIIKNYIQHQQQQKNLIQILIEKSLHGCRVCPKESFY